jgi:Crinkler effector protein N-terminal domain
MLCLRIRGPVAVSAHLSGTRVRRGLSVPQALTFAHRSTSQQYPPWSGFTLAQKHFLTTSSTSRTPPPPSSTTPTAPPSLIRCSILSRFLSASLSVNSGSTSSTSTSLILWCYIEGQCDVFRIRASPNSVVEDLKEQIYNKVAPYFTRRRVDASDLTLTKVRYIVISMRTLM